MSHRRFSRLVDAVAAGRRADSSYKLNAEESEVLRTAIGLRAGRPGEAQPDEGFVSALYEDLARQMQSEANSERTPGRLRRGRIALASVAAAVTLVAGTAVVTETLASTPLSPAAVQASHQMDLRTGTFKTADNKTIGQVVAYRGRPSWIYMNIDDPHYNGTVNCHLQNPDGSTVATGTFDLHGGVGEWSRSIDPQLARIQGAKLIASNGSVLASATFT